MGRIPDSTLGDDEKGFQKLANDKAKANGTYKEPAKKAPITTSSMADGLRALLQPKGYADGGMVQPNFDMSLFDQEMAGMGAPQPPTPVQVQPMTPPAPAPVPPAAAIPPAPAAPHPLMAATQAMASTPDTDPGIYRGITAEDRAALQQQLMARMNSGAGLVAQGAAGIGDAISNSFGGKDTHFQQDVMANNQKQMENRLGAMDTQRAQKLQDIQGPMTAQMADPKSPLAMSMRKTLQSAGLNVPSGMPPSVMLQVAGPLGELAMKQATLAVQQQQVNATQANQEAERHLQAAKDLQDRGIVRKGWEAMTGDSPETAAMRDELKSTGPKAAKTAPAVASAHPQDGQAVQWAKANPHDPRAAKILSLNGF